MPAGPGAVLRTITLRSKGVAADRYLARDTRDRTCLAGASPVHGGAGTVGFALFLLISARLG